MELITQRLYLKPITPALIHELYTTKTRDEIIRFFGFDEAGYEHYRHMHEKGMETHRLSLYFFLLTHRETGTPLGECGFHTWNRSHNRAELFYYLRNDSDKQQGYLTEALPVVLQFGFTELKLHRVEGLVAASNTPSVRLLLRHGFTKEGTMREDYLVNGIQENSDCYSLLKWEWEARSSSARAQG